MIALISAALVAAQPAPAADAHRQMAPMDRQAPTMAEAEAMKEKCCCDDMAKGERDQDAAPDHSQDHHGG